MAILITRKTIKGYDVIDSIVKTNLKVRSMPNRIFDENLGKFKWIVNFNAIAEHQFDNVMNAFSGKKEVDAEELNGMFMTFNIIENEEGVMPILPAKGESVEVTISTAFSKKFDMDVFVVATMRVLPSVKVKKFVFDDEEEFEDETPTAQPEVQPELTGVKATAEKATAKAPKVKA